MSILGKMAQGRAKRLLVLLLTLSLAGSVLLAMPGPVLAENPVVKEIAVDGNKRVPADVILGEVKETRVGQPLSEEAVKKDVEAVGELGYFSNVSIRVFEVAGGVKVVFEVTENPVIKSMEIDGLTTISPENFQKALPVAIGEILNVKKLRDGLQSAITKTFQDYGILARVVDANVEKDGALKVKLAETKLGQIKIEGNKKTKEFVIRRELRIKPGEVLNMKNLQKDLRRVLNLGFFDEVNRKFTETSDPNVLDMTIEVKERPTGSGNIGVGYSGGEGFLGFLEVSDDNAFGLGKRVNVGWQFGKDRTKYDLGYFDPHINDKGTSFGIDLYRRLTYEDLTLSDGGLQRLNVHRDGGSLTVGQPFGEDTRAYLRYKAENVMKDPLDGQTLPPSEMAFYKTRSLTLSAVNDTRDFILKPTGGGRHEVSVEVAGKRLGGDRDFTKYQTDLSRFFKVGRNNQVIALHFNGGLLTGDADPSDYFRVGGSDTVRGYNYLGTDGKTTMTYEDGSRAFSFNTEYRFDVAKGLQGVLFVDAGRAWSQNETFRWPDVKVGKGVGIRIETPVGVMRLDYGLGSAGGGGQTYFSIGQAF